MRLETGRFTPRNPAVLAVAGIAIGSIVAPGKTTDYIKGLQQYPFVNAVVKFGVAFPLTYHALGGVRHMVRIAGISTPSPSIYLRSVISFYPRLARCSSGIRRSTRTFHGLRSQRRPRSPHQLSSGLLPL